MGGQKVDSQEFTPQTILSTVMPGPKWYQAITMAASATTFTYDDSATNPASVIQGVDLTYFDNSDSCNSTPLGNGRQTITGGSFAISNGSTVSLNQMSAFQVGNDAGKANISDMSTVGYIAVVFKSSTDDVPQSQFGTSNYQCIAVSCSGLSCTETGGSAPYSFTMRSATNAQVGDYAEGGVIACLNGSDNDLVVPISDQDGGSGIVWGGGGTATSATSTTDGATNTDTIVDCLSVTSGGGCPGNIDKSTYAAGICDDLSIDGGYTSGWFLPASPAVSGTPGSPSSQLDSIWFNKATIDTAAMAAGGSDFASALDWSSTEFFALDAWYQNFAIGNQSFDDKDNALRVRCVRAITP